ncbi:ankyrin repeat protein [Colletotrichum acutatum]
MDVLGAISSVITIIDTASNSFEALRKIQDRPAAFDTVGHQLSVVSNLLHDILDKAESNNSAIETDTNDEYLKGVRECQAKAIALKEVFHHLEEEYNKAEDSERVWTDHFKNIYKAFMRGQKTNRVENLMADLWKCIERMAVIKIIGMGKPVQRNVDSAMKALEKNQPSLDDSEFDVGGFQANQQISPGATGTQNNIKGNDNIVNSGNPSGEFAGSRIGTVHYGGKYDYLDKIVEIRRRDFLYKLAGTDYDAQLRNTKARLSNTCEWFRQNSGYQEWLGSAEGLLLLCADAGCGKSVIAKYLVEGLLPKEDSTSIICYFFFQESDPQTRSYLSAGKALLHRFLQANPACIDECMKALPSNPDDIPESRYRDVWTVFKTLARNYSSGQIICVLDALDESDPVHRKGFMGCLKDFIFKNDAPSDTRFVITTRKDPQIESFFKNFSSNMYHVDGDNDKSRNLIQGEIAMVMKDRLAKLNTTMNGVSNATLNTIRKGLIEKGSRQRTYLWMHLMFEYIGQTRFCSSQEWKDLFQNPPDTVNLAYEKLLQRVTPSGKEKVRTLLALILAAERPLTIGELSTAVNCRINRLEKRKVKLEEITEAKEFETWMAWQCGSFVTIHRGRAFLVHQTAKEFLLDAPKTSQECWQGSMTEHVIHQYMAESCISFLSIPVFRMQDYNEKLRTQILDAKQKRLRCLQDSLARPTRTSTDEVEDSSTGEESPGEDLPEDLPSVYSSDAYLSSLYYSSEDRDSEDRDSEDLDYGNLDSEDLDSEDIDSKHLSVDSIDNKPSLYNLIKSDRLQNLPLEPFMLYSAIIMQGATKSAMNGNNGRLLQFAHLVLKEDARSMVSERLKCHACKLNIKRSLSPPQLAVYGSSTWCLDYLRTQGLDMNSQDEHGQTLLHKAMLMKDDRIVTYLWELDASRDTRDRNDMTPLTLGAMVDSPWMRKYLKRASEADMCSLLYAAAATKIPDSTMQNVRMPSGASQSSSFKSWGIFHKIGLLKKYHGSAGRVSIIPKLLKAGAKLDYRHEDGLTALHVSVQDERRIHNAVCICAKMPSSVFVVDNEGNTPLHTATLANNVYAMLLLFGHNADVNKAAAALVFVGADVTIKNDDGLTATDLDRPPPLDIGLPRMIRIRNKLIRTVSSLKYLRGFRYASRALYGGRYGLDARMSPRDGRRSPQGKRALQIEPTIRAGRLRRVGRLRGVLR